VPRLRHEAWLTLHPTARAASAALTSGKFRIFENSKLPAECPRKCSPWPPDHSRVDVLHPDGSVSEGVRYRHPDFWEWPPLYGQLGRTVIGWRMHEPGEPK